MRRLFYLSIFFAIQFLFFSAEANAQNTDRDYIRLGNRAFRKGDSEKAVTFFSKALDRKTSVEALYNFGCASLLQQHDSVAISSFLAADSIGFTNQYKRAKNFHNLGNVWYAYGVQQLRSNGQDAGKAFQNAVNLYKSSLRCNPDDNETRYNLAMALHQLKKNQNNGGGGGDSDKNKDKDKDDKNKKEQQKKDEQKQDQQKQDQQQQQQQNKDQMSDEAAEQLLNSAQQDEKSVQQKVKSNPQKRRSLEKDW